MTVAGLLPYPSQPGVVATNGGLDAIWYDTFQSAVKEATRPAVGGTWAAQSVPLLSGINVGGAITTAADPTATPWFAFLGCGGFCVDKLGSPQVAIPIPNAASTCRAWPSMARPAGTGSRTAPW